MIYQLRINQRAAQELGLFEKGIDSNDLAIFDAIKWLCKASFTKKAVKDDSLYVLIDWKLLMAQIPSITITSYRGWKKRLDKLVEVDLIQPHVDNQKTAQSWYKLTVLADRFDSDATTSTYEQKFRGNTKPMNESSDPYEQKFIPPMNESSDYITHSINTEKTHNNKIHGVDSLFEKNEEDKYEIEKSVLKAYNQLSGRSISIDTQTNLEPVIGALKWLKKEKKIVGKEAENYLIEYVGFRNTLIVRNGGYMEDHHFNPQSLFRKTNLNNNFASFEAKRDTNRTYTNEELSDIGLEALAEGLNVSNYKKRIEVATKAINEAKNQEEYQRARNVKDDIQTAVQQKGWF